MLSTSKNVLFPGNIHLLSTGADDFKYRPCKNQSVGSSAPVVSRWLWPGNRTLLEVASMVVSWWLVAFLPSVTCLHLNIYTLQNSHTKYEYTPNVAVIACFKMSLYNIQYERTIESYRHTLTYIWHCCECFTWNEYPYISISFIIGTKELKLLRYLSNSSDITEYIYTRWHY